MHLLIVKNYTTKQTEIVKNTENSYIFPNTTEAETKGNEILKQGKYTAFNTMELNHFIEGMAAKFSTVN